VTHQQQAAAHRQPWLHELSICVDGNATALSAPSGDIEPGTAQGLYVDDVRALSCLRVTVSGEAPSPVAHAASGARAEFLGSARNLGNPGPDPSVEVHRTRHLDGPVLVEEVEVVSRADSTVSAHVAVALAADGAPVSAVKAGHLWGSPAHPETGGSGVRFVLERHSATVAFEPAPARVETADGVATAVFELAVQPGGAARLRVSTTVARTAASALDADRGSDAVTWAQARVVADDPRLAPLVAAALDDLRHLLLRDPEAPDDVFAGAGTPWYLTLFGRDSLWVARMMLPFGTDLAAGTLRALARRQGRRDDPASAEAPGKIPHELRRTAYLDPESGLALPPVYYGTVDATALWVTLLAEARQWGMPEEEVCALLPQLRAAVGWLTGVGRPGEDGLFTYLDRSGSGLANQGWKDSDDAIRWRDGRVAQAPIALVEAQAYAVEALTHAARLLREVGDAEGLGDDGGTDAADATRAEEVAAQLRAAVASSFWVETDAGRHLAIALDGSGAAVDGLGSNMGHVLGTGTLTPAESALVASTVTSGEMLDPFGVRTLGTGNGGFNPIGYHTGSIWTHDTAIVAWGLSRDGHGPQAALVARALVASAEAFDYRWPELYSGRPMMGRPAPYPASCRPQAWSAASAGVLVSVALGLRPDGAGGLVLDPVRPAPFGSLRVEGLRFRGQSFAVTVDADGRASVEGLAGGFEVRDGSA
jgi:glycogen debranching enzyme